jgi:hypothetical protein
MTGTHRLLCSCVRSYTEHVQACRYHQSMQHACTSAEGPRTTNGRAVQANHTNDAYTPLGAVWVRAR